MCIWCLFRFLWFLFLCGFSVLLCFLAKRTVLYSCTKRKGIKLTHKKKDLLSNVVFHFVHWNLWFFLNPNHTQIIAFIHRSLDQVWMLSLLNYGSWGCSVTEVSSVRGNEGIIKRIQGPDIMIVYNWNKQCHIWLMLDFPSNFIGILL